MTQKIKPRHPEKIKNPINPIKKKPNWIRSKLINSREFFVFSSEKDFKSLTKRLQSEP